METTISCEPTSLIDAELYEELVSIRRDLHRHPELSWQEKRTAEKVAAFLDRYHIPYRRGVAKTGIVAELPGEEDGPVVALRADLDALPVLEETGLPFASEVPGVMHACGHDGHTAMLLGAAALLARETKLRCPTRLIFQPGEETGRGAPAMVNAGVLEGVGAIFGGHVDRHFPVGSIVVTEGVVNASSDRFVITISGQGGHAARPHEAVDAVVVGSLMVMAIQTIVSREVNPAHPSVVTIGRFDAGTAANVIAGQAKLEGTIRAQDEPVRRHLMKSIRRIAESVGQLHGAHVEVVFREGSPSLWNRGPATRIARRAAERTVGASCVLEMTSANMGGEDFAHYLEHVPGCYVRFGSTRPGETAYPAHSSRFDFDERVLAVGAAFFHQVALSAMETWASNGEGSEA